MRAAGVERGTKVVTVANAGMYSGFAIGAIGATPVHVDIDPRTMLMDPQRLASADFSGVSAIVATHLYGRLADMEKITTIASERGVR
jgi:dTDP-4-amino-4,6-dideoxygalactose transaminase